jgi:hypothetical protein
MAFGISDEHWVESLFVESAPEGYTGAEHVASKEDITLGPTSSFDIIYDTEKLKKRAEADTLLNEA